MKLKKGFICGLLILCSQFSFAQDEGSIDRWDNWFLLGNKLAFGGKNSIRHSHELQWRVDNNMRSLNVWYYEGVLTYSPNAVWEVVPDFRASIQPDKTDFRFGLGLVRKNYLGTVESKYKKQLVQQLKYQMDIDSKGDLRHGVRLVFTYNQIINDNFIISGLSLSQLYTY